jgi:hypothetical protein
LITLSKLITGKAVLAFTYARPMSTASINHLELEVIREIFAEESYLEGERRGCPVQYRDPVVRCRVADILINGKGAELRQRFEAVVQTA